MAEGEGGSVLGRIRGKLVESKQRWAREGRLLTGSAAPPAQRLPPGQRLVGNWPVLDLGVRPDVPTGSWRLSVEGAVERPQDWNWGAFTDLKMRRMRSDIHCVTAWSRYDNDWTGLGALDLLDLVRPSSDARHVIFHSYDGYTTNLTLERFAVAEALLATHWNGEPLSVEHGGPLRAVVPALYFWKSAKWLRRIEFSAVDKPGFWETRGYHNEGDPWREERYG